MNDKKLALIFYMIVHDFEDNWIKCALAERRLKLEPNYLRSIKDIRDWARENQYYVIEDRATNMLKKIRRRSVEQHG